MFPSQEEVNWLRERYPVGTKIVLDHMGNDPHPIPDGTKGTVRHVDDAGTVHCIFENGRYLGLIPGEDSFHVMKEKTLQEILSSIDQKRDVFWVFPKDQLVFEAYYNPDSNAGGQFVFNSFSFNMIIAAEIFSAKDPNVFYEYLDTICVQECVDITEDLETVEDAASQLNGKADYEGHTRETMEALIKVVHETKTKEVLKKQSHGRDR
ncbi:MAG: DUF4314 domain-containing protein [Clostridia bacterium]|nr:DUF4314 domain-containing protein [Clostridia bacterium]